MIAFINPATWGSRLTSVMGDPRPYGPHEGIDLAPTVGGPYPVVASASGTVLDAGYQEEGYGYFVKLDHGDGLQTLYGHFAGPAGVTKGEYVFQGQQIGLTGSTGYSTGTHLHFHITQNGQYVNPLDFINIGVASLVTAGQNLAGELADIIRQAGGPIQGDDCPEPPDGASLEELYAWGECVRGHLPEASAAQLGVTLEEYKARAERGPQNFLSGPDFEGMLADVKASIIDGATLPPRMLINAFKLSDVPLTGGADTLAWLRQPANQKLYLASIVALLIVVVLLFIAAASFLKEPALAVADVAL